MNRSSLYLSLAVLASCCLPTVALARPGMVAPSPLGPQGRPFYEAIAHTSPTVGMPGMVAQVALTFLGDPYLPSTLDQFTSPDVDAPEPLTCRLDAFDCVTLVENSVAIARAVALAPPGHAASWNGYRRELERIRYRHGVRAGYASRLHYFSEWIADNERRGNVQDLTASLGGDRDTRPLNFMSTHRGSYRKLGDNRVYKEIQAVEVRLAKDQRYVLSNARVAQIVPLLQSGDILAFATDIAGLDVVHTGLVERLPNGEVHLLHAPEPGQVVMISKLPLVDYLKVYARHVGLIIARPLPPRPEH